MRLREIDGGDSFVNRLLINFISLVSGMRLPDAARVALYHKDFFGTPLGEWTQAAMRGSSEWSVGERELMAALVAKWNSCSFCVRAHGAVSAKGLERSTVDAALADYHGAPISEGLKVTLEFLEDMTLRPTRIDLQACEGSIRGWRRRGSPEGRNRSWRGVQHSNAIRQRA
jgi:AhpD family alkylhydroperoxidase